MSHSPFRFALISIIVIGGLLAQGGAPDPKADQPPPIKPAESARPVTAGVVSEVTLYRGTALVTRKIAVPTGHQGAFELVISPLPTATLSESVHADHTEGVTVRSVTCRTRAPLDPEKLEGNVAQLDRSIREIERAMAKARNEIALRRIRQGYLRSLENFVAPAATQEMTRGVLQADELQKVTTMHFREYETASQEILENDFDLKDAEEKLGALKSERDKLAAGPPVSYEAVVFLDVAGGAGGSFHLNYLVKDCGWEASYNMRGHSQKNEVELEFNALIHQVSGEDWTNAALTLSTASPAVAAYNPRLEPLYVALAPVTNHAPTGEAERYGKAVAGRRQAYDSISAKPGSGEKEANVAANDSAASVQLIELSERLNDLRRLDETVATQELTMDYRLAQPATVVSRREPQIVHVLRHTSAAAFQHVAAPILTSAVFREAVLTNTSAHDLLGGRVSIYLDGTFTGRNVFPTIARGRSVTMGFGIDGQLRARRMLVDRSEDVQGGNRRVNVTTEVVIDSFKDQPVTVQVRERLPHFEDTASLRVTLGAVSQPLSQDSDYLRFERPKGLLLWAQPVKPGAGAEATTLRYAYSLEFDKNLVLSDLATEQKTRLREIFLRQSSEKKVLSDLKQPTRQSLRP